MQIRVPPQLDDILKAYTKEVIRRKPEDLVEFSAFYFANLANIVPETTVVVQPTLQQIESLYRELSNATDSTCDVRLSFTAAVVLSKICKAACCLGGPDKTCSTLQTNMVTLRAQDAGINENTVSEVLKVGQFSITGPVDPAQFCVLLITTITLDVPGLLGAIVQVFGDGTSLDAKLCQQVLTALGKYDDRWHGDVMQQIEGAAEEGVVTESILLELPEVKGMVQTGA